MGPIGRKAPWLHIFAQNHLGFRHGVALGRNPGLQEHFESQELDENKLDLVLQPMNENNVFLIIVLLVIIFIILVLFFGLFWPIQGFRRSQNHQPCNNHISDVSSDKNGLIGGDLNVYQTL